MTSGGTRSKNTDVFGENKSKKALIIPKDPALGFFFGTVKLRIYSVENAWHFEELLLCWALSGPSTYVLFVWNFNTKAKPCFTNTYEEGTELLKRKPNKQYHTENQGSRSRPCFQLLSKRKQLLNFIYFTAPKNTRRDTLRTGKPLLLAGNSKKPSFSADNILKNWRIFWNFL